MKQKLMAEQEEIRQENLSLKTDTLILHSDKERLLRDVRKATDEKEQIQVKKEGFLEDIGVLDKEFEKRLDFINVLDKLKALFYKLLSMIPLVREFAKFVEEKKDMGRLPLWLYPSRQAVKVSEIREEIMPENRICTLELAEVYVKAVESFMEDMEPEERTRENRPMYQRQNEEYIQGR